MAKTIAPRVSKKERKVIDTEDKAIRSDLYRILDDNPVLRGADLEFLKLSDIVVKEQVRTKFNDASLKELGENIKVNGLIQPLVVHREGGKYVLICGERRFRAMTLINKKDAPCFVLSNKTPDELMSIQFSENSSREQLHYIDKADGILNYQKVTKASERKIVAALGISKSEVHRSLLIAQLPREIKEAAKTYNIEKYVLVELDAITDKDLKDKISKLVCSGKITKRLQIKRAILENGELSKRVVSANRKKARKPVSASVFMKALNLKAKDMEIDKKTRELLKNLVEEARDLTDL